MAGLLAVMVASLASSVTSYSMGAPDAACRAMTPGHQQEPQQGPAPANLSFSSTWVRPGEMLGVKLQANDGKFKGFIIQARAAKDAEVQVGSFVVSGDQASYMTCGRGIHNSITHRTNILKDEIGAQWRAPFDYTGAVVFRYTYLREYTTYWVAVETPAIRVAREAPEEEEEEEVQPEAPADTPSTSLVLQASPKSEGSDTANAITVVEDKEQEEEAKKAEEVDVIKPSSVAEDTVETVESNTPIYISSTTTLRTTTSTTEEPREALPIIDGVAQVTAPDDPIYSGCSTTSNSSKACFGLPRGCEATKNCQVVVSYRPQALDYLFEMKGRSNGYISMGLSRDDVMGEDLTTTCLIQRNGQVDIITGYNIGHSGNMNILGKETAAVSEKRSVKDGWISCSWKRKADKVLKVQVQEKQEDWDLRHKFHIMLAQGEASDGKPLFHTAKLISGVKVGLGEVGLIQAKSNLFIVLHGSFMIAAWVCAASLGIIIARYYKQTWTNTRCCNLDQWFVWHRSLMMLCWSLTVVAVVLILLELKGLSTTMMTNPHTLLGFITVALCFIQPFLALVRCAPTHRYRGIFNWVHWFIGNSAQILGIVCIFYAVDLDKAQLPRPETDWLLVGFVGFHFLSHLLLSGLSCCAESSGGQGGYPLALRPMGRNGGPYPDYEELKRDQPGSSIRTFVLFVYMIVNVIVTAALILLVVLAPTRQQLVKIGILPSVPATL